jgi:hypothetical protein
LRLAAAGGPTQHLWFKEVCLWRLTPEPWWEDEPGLMALYPLCQHRRQPREAIGHAAQTIEGKMAGEVERADTLYLLSIFGGLAYPRLDVAAIIGREKMNESRFGRELREEGERRGLRNAILEVLRERFGPAASTEFAGPLDEVSRRAHLVPLVRLAATCSDVEAFCAGLPAQPRRR